MRLAHGEPQDFALDEKGAARKADEDHRQAQRDSQPEMESPHQSCLTAPMPDQTHGQAVLSGEAVRVAGIVSLIAEEMAPPKPVVLR